MLYKKSKVKTLVFANYINVASGLVFVFLTLKTLGLSDFGLFSVYQVFGLILSSFSNFKLWEPLLIILRRKGIVKGGYFKSSLFFEFFSSLFLYLIYVSIIITLSFFSVIDDYNLKTIFISGAISIFTAISTYNAIVRYYRFYNIVFFSNLMSGIVKLSGFFVCSTINDIITLSVFSELVRYIIYFITINLIIDFSKYEIKYSIIKEIVHSSYRLNLASICDIPINYLDRFVIFHALGADVTGFYTLIKRIGSMINILINSIYQHEYSNIIKNEIDNNVFNIVYSKTKNIFLMMFIVFIVCVLLFNVKSVLGIVPEQIKNNIFFCFSYLLSLVFSYCVIFYHPVFIFYNGQDKIVQYTLLSNFVYILLLYFLSLNIGFPGIIIATLTQSSLLLYLKVIYVKNFNKN